MVEAALTATAGAKLAASAETPTARAIRRFRRRKGALLALAVIAIFVSAAVLAPLISPYDPDLQTWTAVRKAPSALHWFGTDDVGRDVLARVNFWRALRCWRALFPSLSRCWSGCPSG
jgi:peptide/nickel transport system permease protein